MNRYMIYLPDDNTWMEAVVALQSHGKPQSDSLYLVTLASDSGMSEIEAALKATGKHFVLTKIEDNFLSYHVTGQTLSAVRALR
ncbi:hypothetical protein LVY75_12495 [Sinorhizobium sp. B11]